MDDFGKVFGSRSIAAAALCALSVACSPDETVPVEEAAARVRARSAPAEQERGRSLYSAACASCHGRYGEGREQGPPMLHPLQARMHDDFAFERAVREGVRPHHYQLGTMPPVGDLSPEDVAAIVGYVRWMQEVAGLR